MIDYEQCAASRTPFASLSEDEAEALFVYFKFVHDPALTDQEIKQSWGYAPRRPIPVFEALRMADRIQYEIRQRQRDEERERIRITRRKIRFRVKLCGLTAKAVLLLVGLVAIAAAVLLVEAIRIPRQAVMSRAEAQVGESRREVAKIRKESSEFRSQCLAEIQSSNVVFRSQLAEYCQAKDQLVAETNRWAVGQIEVARQRFNVRFDEQSRKIQQAADERVESERKDFAAKEAAARQDFSRQLAELGRSHTQEVVKVRREVSNQVARLRREAEAQSRAVAQQELLKLKDEVADIVCAGLGPTNDCKQTLRRIGRLAVEADPRPFGDDAADLAQLLAAAKQRMSGSPSASEAFECAQALKRRLAGVSDGAALRREAVGQMAAGYKKALEGGKALAGYELFLACDGPRQCLSDEFGSDRSVVGSNAVVAVSSKESAIKYLKRACDLGNYEALQVVLEMSKRDAPGGLTFVEYWRYLVALERHAKATGAEISQIANWFHVGSQDPRHNKETRAAMKGNAQLFYQDAAKKR